MELDKMKHSSGTNKHTAVFSYAGEIRFGPPYYDLEIDGRIIVGRRFSEHPVWSDNERYLALQEWHTTNDAAGPSMKLCIFDLERGCEYSGTPVHGYTIPLHFESSLLVYEKRDWSKGYEVITTIELDLNAIKTWKPTDTGKRVRRLP